MKILFALHLACYTDTHTDVQAWIYLLEGTKESLVFARAFIQEQEPGQDEIEGGSIPGLCRVV